MDETIDKIMDEIEKLHLKTILNAIDEDASIELNELAYKSAKITEQIAIEFLRYYHQTAELSFHSTGHNQGKPHPEIYQEFLKDYKKLNS